MDEHRKSKRLALTALAEVTLPNGKNVPTYVSNISREGLGIYFKEPLKAGTDLNIKLFYRNNSGHMKFNMVKGQVKWAFNGFYALGIGLDKLNAKDHGELLDLIDQAENHGSQLAN